MEIGALKRDIKANNLKHFYIFTGAEVAVQDVYIKQIAKVTKTEIQRIDEVKDVYKSQKSLFAKPKCFICRDDNDFIKTEKGLSNSMIEGANNKRLEGNSNRGLTNKIS